MRKHSDEMDSGVRMSNRCLRKTLDGEKSLEETGKLEDIGESSLERVPTVQWRMGRGKLIPLPLPRQICTYRSKCIRKDSLSLRSTFLASRWRG